VVSNELRAYSVTRIPNQGTPSKQLCCSTSNVPHLLPAFCLFCLGKNLSVCSSIDKRALQWFLAYNSLKPVHLAGSGIARCLFCEQQKSFIYSSTRDHESTSHCANPKPPRPRRQWRSRSHIPTTTNRVYNDFHAPHEWLTISFRSLLCWRLKLSYR
jgi:hypothetical protein